MTRQCSHFVNFCQFVAVLSITLEPTVSTFTYSSDFLKLGLETCNEQISFCTLTNKSAVFRPCCSQCSCWSSCYEKGGCCPDISMATFRFNHSCHSVVYKNSQLVNKLDELPDRRYEMVTKCPDGRDCNIDHTMMDEKVSFNDIVPVYNEQLNAIFQNKKCAECNNITTFIRWRLIASDCKILTEGKPVQMSGEELVRHVLDNCVVFSFPPLNTLGIHTQRCDFDYVDSSKVIDVCNNTGEWDVYDEDMENACLDKNFIFHARYRKTIYKNVYCFLCNSPLHARLTSSCYLSTWDRFTTEFIDIMDLKTDFFPVPNRITNQRKCKDNEIVDELFNTCTPVVCPGYNFFSDDMCKALPFKIEDGVSYRVTLMLIPKTIIPLNISVTPHDRNFFDQLFENIPDVSVVKDICIRADLESVTVHWERESLVLHSFYVEMNIISQPNYDNCTYENLAKVLDRLITNKALNVSMFSNSESVETVTLMLAPDNRTQVFNSLERLGPNNKTYSSETTVINSQPTFRYLTKVVDIPYTCPHVTLSEAKLCRLASIHQNQPCTVSESFLLEYNIVTHTFVHSYADYLDNRLSRFYSLCLQEYKLLSQEYKLLSKKWRPKPSTAMGFLSLVLSCISMSCTLMILILFIITKKITNGPMVIFGCALLNLFIAQSVFQFGSGWPDKYTACQVIGVAIHYFWLSSVFALNAYCVLVLRKIQSISNQMCSTDLVVSLFYVYGLPVMFILANIIYTNVDSTAHFASGYGVGQCHINTTLMRGLLFAMPILLTVVLNCLVNGMVAIKIKQIQTPVSSLRKETRYATVYFRLLIVTGLTWFFGILKELVISVVIDYCFTVFVGGQGILLLISFVCRKHFCQDISLEFRSRKSNQFVSRTNTAISENDK